MMENLLRNTTAIGRAICQNYIKEFKKCDAIGQSIIAVDATCGNGHDTFWLAQNCDKVYAFDIQESAIRATFELIKANNLGEKVELICESHENIRRHIEGEVSVIVFNLGYLPGGDKEITTEVIGTLRALQDSLDILRINGILCVTMYPGHSAGREEYKAVLSWAEGLDKKKYHCIRTDMLNQPDAAPEILFVTKKRK